MENLTSNTTPELSIDELEKMADTYKQRAEELRREKREEQIKAVSTLVREHNIQPEEIFSPKALKSGKATKAVKLDKEPKVKRAYKVRAMPAPPKYRSADGTQTWNGLGRRPKWIAELAEKDKTLASALIKT